jgi:hypothetical protein
VLTAVLSPSAQAATRKPRPTTNRSSCRARLEITGTSMLNAFNPPPTTAAMTQATPALSSTVFIGPSLLCRLTLLSDDAVLEHQLANRGQRACVVIGTRADGVSRPAGAIR